MKKFNYFDDVNNIYNESVIEFVNNRNSDVSFIDIIYNKVRNYIYVEKNNIDKICNMFFNYVDRYNDDIKYDYKNVNNYSLTEYNSDYAFKIMTDLCMKYVDTMVFYSL